MEKIVYMIDRIGIVYKLQSTLKWQYWSRSNLLDIIDLMGLVCRTSKLQIPIWLCGVVEKTLDCRSVGCKFESRIGQVSIKFQYFNEFENNFK